MEGIPENVPGAVPERELPPNVIEKRRSEKRKLELESLLPQGVVIVPGRPMGINLHVEGNIKFEEMTRDDLFVFLKKKLTDLDRLKRELISNVDDTNTRVNLRQTMLDGLRQAGLTAIEDADLKSFDANRKLLRKQESDLDETERKIDEFSSLLQKIREVK